MRIPLHKPAGFGVVGAGAVVVQVQGVVVEGVQFAAGESIWVAVQARSSEFVVRSKDVDFSLNIVFAAFGDCAGVIQQGDGRIQVVMEIEIVIRPLIHDEDFINVISIDERFVETASNIR